MLSTNRVQAPENGSGVMYVLYPANPGPGPDGLGTGNPNEAIYVEFDVPTQQFRWHDKGLGWGRVYGPGSLEARFAARKGTAVPTEMPEARNIKLRVGNRSGTVCP